VKRVTLAIALCLAGCKVDRLASNRRFFCGPNAEQAQSLGCDGLWLYESDMGSVAEDESRAHELWEICVQVTDECLSEHGVRPTGSLEL